MDPGFVGRDPGALAQHYLANATDLLDKGRREKAAELFWGAVAAAIRAVAFRSGRDFTTHNGLRMFLYQLAKDAGDDRIRLLFKSAETLHSHFYRPDRDPGDIDEAARDAAALVERLLEIARS